MGRSNKKEKWVWIPKSPMNVRRVNEQRPLIKQRVPQFAVVSQCGSSLGKFAFNQRTRSMHAQWSVMMHVLKVEKASEALSRNIFF